MINCVLSSRHSAFLHLKNVDNSWTFRDWHANRLTSCLAAQGGACEGSWGRQCVRLVEQGEVKASSGDSTSLACCALHSTFDSSDETSWDPLWSPGGALVGRPEAHTGPEEEEEVGQRSERDGLWFELNNICRAWHTWSENQFWANGRLNVFLVPFFSFKVTSITFYHHRLNKPKKAPSCYS